jgi:hypothetical protein
METFMSGIAHHIDFRVFSPVKASSSSGARARKPGLLRRILDAVVESDQRRSDREVAAVLARSGGRFTDAMEREMFERQFGSNWWPR